MFITTFSRPVPLRFNGNARDLNRAALARFDRLFNEPVERSQSPSEAAAPRVPAADVHETEQAYTLWVDLPGVAKDDVKITVDGKQLRIEAQAAPTAKAAKAASAADAADAAGAEAAAPAAERVLVRERRQPAYARSFTFAAELDDSAATAKLENGVLELTLQKKRKPAVQITVN